MLAALAFGTLLAYQFPVGVRQTYEVDVQFEGFVPMLGGIEGKVDVAIKLAVRGLEPDGEGRPQVVSEIEEFGLKLNDARMPFERQNLDRFFPKTTVSIDPRGKVLATDAPDRVLPGRLPGLDVQRFPDITYLPIEFPSEGIAAGQTFRFTKTFNGSVANYTVTPGEPQENLVPLTIEVEQRYTTFEDGRANLVAKERAKEEVETTVAGKGEARFDLAVKQVRDLRIVADAEARVRPVAGEGERTRRLRTILTVKRETSVTLSR
jgi:hypothetical protein